MKGNTMLNNLASALSDLGVNVRLVGNTLFVKQWGIFCSATGNIQARSLWDSSERFGLGTTNTPIDVLVAEIVALP